MLQASIRGFPRRACNMHFQKFDTMREELKTNLQGSFSSLGIELS